jgi:defect-in-organelle-trafficking protein DotB
MMAQTLVPGLKGIRVAARSWLQLDADMRDELMEMTDMGRVTGALRTMMDDGAGWTFAQEADKLLSMKAISEETAHRLRNKA